VIAKAVHGQLAAGLLPVDVVRQGALFGTRNRDGWDTGLTILTALGQLLPLLSEHVAAPEPVEAVRALLHGAMALYLARYLNVPPASLPGERGDSLNDLPVAAKEICAALLDAFDRQRQIDAAARLVARFLTLDHPPETLIATLAQALLREDAGFHAYQMLEAGVRQFHEWGNCDQGRHILIAVSRYLAAHFPTQRALLQTADIATRLMRGGELHREAQAVG
jgi:predicted kinase